METAIINKIVVHFKNETIMKGTTSDFFPNKTQFHLIDVEGKTEAIDVDQLKAIFFVKDLVGNKSRPDHYDISTTGAGRKIRVEFYDNEVIIGQTLGYSPDRQGFFMTPADPQSNNGRIFVVKTAAKNIKLL
ncbi:MAG: hypothetical protein OS130_13955 [Thermodesulfobacteriota bacterium]|jgi:hypothetical protein|nr:MAG: hypothetical protein OS130_13955 [Thermodesulfobacteriota bacterium]